jgi:hypothetical protein
MTECGDGLNILMPEEPEVLDRRAEHIHPAMFSFSFFLRELRWEYIAAVSPSLDPLHVRGRVLNATDGNTNIHELVSCLW